MPVHIEFPREVAEKVIAAQRGLADIVPFIDDIESCGVQCQAQRALAETLRKTLAEIEHRFITPSKKGE